LAIEGSWWIAECVGEKWGMAVADDLAVETRFDAIVTRDNMVETASASCGAKILVKIYLKLIKNTTLPYLTLETKKTGLNRLRPVFCGSTTFHIVKDRRPDRGLWSLPVLIICGPDRFRSGLVPVFFRSRDRTSKHYSFMSPTRSSKTSSRPVPYGHFT